MIQNTVSYNIAFSMYVALGGDPNATFDSVDAVYAAIDVLFGEAGQSVVIDPLSVTLTENGNYNYNSDSVTGYKPVDVTVNIDTDSFYQNGYNDGFTQGESEGYNDGYTEGLEDGAADQKALLETITISENGTYTREDGYNEVIVDVASSDGGNGFDFTEIGYSQALSNDLNSVTINALEYSKEILQKWNNDEINSGAPISAFINNRELVYCPSLNIDNARFSNRNEPESMFYDCSNLKVVGDLTFTKSITSSNSMFRLCSSLTTVTLFDTSSVTNTGSMFYSCSSLTTIPLFDTSSVTNMNNMFYGCSLLTTLPLLDTSSVTIMSKMFQACTSLTTIPLFDTSSVTNMSNMFYGCNSLTSIPALDTSSVTNMDSMFTSCTKLVELPLLDCSNVNDVDTYFGYSSLSYLTTLGGFKNLGMQATVSGTSNSYFLDKAPNLTYESIMNVINNLYDRATAGLSVMTLKINSKTMTLLSDADKAIATNKGWTLS